MTLTPDILAQANGGWIEIVIILGFLVISAIVGLLRKASERRADEQDLEQRKRSSTSQTGGEQASRRRYKPISPRGQEQQSQPPQQQPRQQPPPRPRPQAQPQQAQPQVRVQRPQASQTPQALRAAQAYRQRRRDAELREKQRAAIRKQQQQQAELKRRQEALKRRSAAVARKSATYKDARRLTQLRGLGGRTGTLSGQEQGARGFSVKILSAADARRAMVYHEIFSPPKALRRGQEMWDV